MSAASALPSYLVVSGSLRTSCLGAARDEDQVDPGTRNAFEDASCTPVACATCSGETFLPGLFLSKHGVRVDGRRLLGRTDAKRMNAVMLTCGTYDAAGEFAYRVGLPAESGVGGGVLAVIPQHGTVCAWGPRLDAAGNSVAAIAALDEFTTASGLSVF